MRAASFISSQQGQAIGGVPPSVSPALPCKATALTQNSGLATPLLLVPTLPSALCDHHAKIANTGKQKQTRRPE